MGSDLTTIAEGVLSFAATYWLHSTALISAVYLLLRLRSQWSHALKERLWKFSAVAGLFTAGLQSAAGFGFPILPAKESPVSESRVLASASVIQEPQVVDASTALPATATIDESLLLVRESLARLQNSTTKLQATVDERSVVAASSGDLPPENVEILSIAASHVDEFSVETSQQLASETSPMVASGEWPAPSPAVDSRSRGIVVVWWVGLTLAAVTAIGFLLFVGQWLVFLVDTRGIVSATDRQLQILRRLQRRLGVTQRIDLRVSHRLSEPVAYGVLQWMIVLPDRLEERLTPDELDSLLAHEIAHLVRGDIMWMHVGRFLATALAWQPLNFLVRARWQAEAEFQCDDWAIRRSIDPVALARC